MPACEHFGLGLLPFFPLDSGLLSGKYRRGEAPAEGTRLAQDRYQRWLDERRLGHHRGADRVRRGARATACSTSPSPGWPPGPP